MIYYADSPSRSNLGSLLGGYGLPGFYFSARALTELSSDRAAIAFVGDGRHFPELEFQQRNGDALYYEPASGLHIFKKRKPVYHALLPHTTFIGAGVHPLWLNGAGEAVVAWYERSGGKRQLLVGLDFEEEMVRHRQGNPDSVQTSQDRAAWGFPFERPNYLYDAQLASEYPFEPWADRLGFLIARAFAQVSGCPLLHPLPFGARGLVLLTGDDDQANLEKYNDQMGVLGSFPMTYFLVPQTRHTRETLSQFPANFEIGVHPDALDDPRSYDRLCGEQTAFIRALSGRPARIVRNHGYLNEGYLGHLRTWEKQGLVLDANLPGVNGTCRSGSFLPFRVRRADKTWSDHFSLLTAFGDGVLSLFSMTEKQAIRRIRDVASRFSGEEPGTLCFNFHPQNIDDTRKMHRAVIKLGKSRGWIAMGLESYLDWLDNLTHLRVVGKGAEWTLHSAGKVDGLCFKYWKNGAWRGKSLTSWRDKIEIELV